MSNTARDLQPVNLFWTGGLDSTFQLLRLLVLYKLPVQPHYLIDPDRQSIGLEFQTMRRIRNRIRRKYPHTRELFPPTILFEVGSIPPDKEITAAHRSAEQRMYLGTQYDWIPRYCKHAGVDDMELCVHIDESMLTELGPHIIRTASEPRNIDRVAPTGAPDDLQTLFKYFTFPLHDVPKPEMMRVSEANGWTSIMTSTWSCHLPLRGNIPCGACTPCTYAIAAGLTWRVPPASIRRAAMRQRLGINRAEAFCQQLKRGFARMKKHLRGQAQRG